MMRRRTNADGARVIVRFTAQVLNEVRSNHGALAASAIAEGLGAPPQGWRPPETPCYAWVEYSLEALGHMTRALRLLAGPAEVAERERLALMAADGFGASVGTFVPPAGLTEHGPNE